MGNSAKHGFPGPGAGGTIQVHLPPNGADCGVGIDHPGIANLGGALDGAIVIGRHPDRGVRLLQRPYEHAGVVEFAVGGVVGDGVPGPQLFDDLQMFEQPWHAFAFAKAKGLVFYITVAETNAEDEAPTSDDIERGCFFCYGDGVEQRQEVDGDAHTHAPGFGG
jgi:hypothetical protein